ncbi:MAG: hypothetical protein CM15mL4_2890 [uncultured marine virus]|nr:MAG: hypothetical protein CM15mL4_2890 [uncultured marine virus]
MNNFEIRKSIYDDIRKNCNLITDNGIQLEIDLNSQQTSMLQLSVENYILKTLESYYEMKFERENFWSSTRIRFWVYQIGHQTEHSTRRREHRTIQCNPKMRTMHD